MRGPARRGWPRGESCISLPCVGSSLLCSGVQTAAVIFLELWSPLPGPGGLQAGLPWNNSSPSEFWLLAPRFTIKGSLSLSDLPRSPPTPSHPSFTYLGREAGGKGDMLGKVPHIWTQSIWLSHMTLDESLHFCFH